MKKITKFLEKRVPELVLLAGILILAEYFVFPDRYPAMIFKVILPCVVVGALLILLLFRYFFPKKESDAGVNTIQTMFIPGNQVIVGESMFFGAKKIAELLLVVPGQTDADRTAAKQVQPLVMLNVDQKTLTKGRQYVITDNYLLLPVGKDEEDQS